MGARIPLWAKTPCDIAHTREESTGGVGTMAKCLGAGVTCSAYVLLGPDRGDLGGVCSRQTGRGAPTTTGDIDAATCSPEMVRSRRGSQASSGRSRSRARPTSRWTPPRGPRPRARRSRRTVTGRPAPQAAGPLQARRSRADTRRTRRSGARLVTSTRAQRSGRRPRTPGGHGCRKRHRGPEPRRTPDRNHANAMTALTIYAQLCPKVDERARNTTADLVCGVEVCTADVTAAGSPLGGALRSR